MGVKTIFILIGIVFLQSCGDDEGYVDVEVQREAKKKGVQASDLISCNCNELVTNEEGIRTLNGDLYSGICYSNYPNIDQKYEEQFYLKGEIQWHKFYSKTGDLLTQSNYKDGVREDVSTSCDCNDLVDTERDGVTYAMLNNKRFTGDCKSYYPTVNQIYIEEEFKGGLRHGKSIMYSKNGDVLTLTHYLNGTRIEK